MTYFQSAAITAVLLFAISLASPTISAQTQPSSPCRTHVLDHEIFFRVDDSQIEFIIRVKDLQGTLLYDSWTDTEVWGDVNVIRHDDDILGDCDWYAGFESKPWTPAFNRYTTLVIEFLGYPEKTANPSMPASYVAKYTVGGRSLDGSNNFFCPNCSESLGYQDFYFAYTDGQLKATVTNLVDRGGGPDLFIEDFLGSIYIAPYDLRPICEDVLITCGEYNIADVTAQVVTRQTGSNLAFSPYGDVVLLHDRTFPIYGGIRTWNWSDASGYTLQFPDGKRLIARGDFIAEGATFTEADAGQGWGGIAVYSGGTLDLDAVTITDAEVGIEVHSAGNHFNDVLLDGNGVGLLAGPHCAYGGLCIEERSAFSMASSCVTNSEADPLDPDTGYGIWALAADAAIATTTVEDNDGHGLFLGDADVAVNDFLLTTNGGSRDQDGARVSSGGDLTLASYFTGGVDERLSFLPGANAVTDNDRHQIAIQLGGYGTVGLVCGIKTCPAESEVSGTFGAGSLAPKLIWNAPPDVSIPAWNTYWATTPSDPPDDAFLQPSLVDDYNALSSAPGSGVGHPDGCASAGVAEPFGGEGPGGLRASAPGGTSSARELPGSGLRLDPEDAAWLRGRIAAMRAALAANPEADSAAALLGRLYGLQRLDRRDELGERPATTGLLTSLRERLLEAQSLSPALRRTAEAALVASVHDALRSGEVQATRALLDSYGERVEGEETQRTLALAAVSADARTGELASALSRLYALLAELGPEEPLAADLEATAALYERWLAERGETAPARGAHYVAGGASVDAAPDLAAAAAQAPGAAVAGLTVYPAYPNPFNPSTVVPFEVGAAAHVEIAVFDLLGRRVALLAEGRYEAGRYEARFDASALPSGMYLLRSRIEPEPGAASGAVLHTQRLLLTK